MSYLKLAGLFARMTAEDDRAKERAALCGTGAFEWFCHLRSPSTYHALVTADNQIGGVPAWRWWKVACAERFQRAAKSQRPLCGARCRSGQPCRARRIVRADGTLARRCRMHGGLSCGPKTAAGRAAIAASNRRRAKPQITL